jgi:hypothetical protein
MIFKKSTTLTRELIIDEGDGEDARGGVESENFH